MSDYSGAQKISKIEMTEDDMTGRGGVFFFSRYLGSIELFGYLDLLFGHLRGSAKAMPVWHLFKQVLCFFFDGTSSHLTYFDTLRRDEGYAAMLEEPADRLASSHAIKRLFKLFKWTDGKSFRWLLRTIFIWRLKIEKPSTVIFTVDTMVMDNDDAYQRHGVSPTYKKVKGFQPLHFIWNNLIVDAVFRGGKKSGNAGDTVINVLTELVDEIRKGYCPDVPIIVRFDSGFYDEKILIALDALNVGFIMTGKMYEPIKKHARAMAGEPLRMIAGESLQTESCLSETWGRYDNGHQAWSYFEFGYRGKSWKTCWRSFYTKPLYEERQMLLDFARPDNVIHTNIGQNQAVFAGLAEKEARKLSRPEAIIECHHQRGADELPHRGLKDYGFEQLPFKRFPANNAFYYCMVLSFNLFECFKRDVLVPDGIAKTGSYASTVRRTFVDFAAKVVHTARQRIMKATKSAFEYLKLDAIFKRLQEVVPLPS